MFESSSEAKNSWFVRTAVTEHNLGFGQVIVNQREVLPIVLC